MANPDDTFDTYGCLFAIAFMISMAIYQTGYYFGKNDILDKQGIQRQEATDIAAEAAANG